MTNPILYGLPHATCTQTVLTSAAERGVAVDLHPIDISKGEHKQAAHLARQPFGKIPALQHGDLSMYESRAISAYINELGSKGRDLAGSTPQERARVQQWVQLNTHTYIPAIGKIVYQRTFGPVYYKQPTDETVIKAAVDELQTPFDVLETQLSKTAYLAGAEYTFADLFFLSYVHLLTSTPEWTALTSTRPHVSKWWHAISARPAWQAVLAQAQSK